MTEHQLPDNLASSLAELKPKDKAPSTMRALEGWINKAQEQLETAGPRLGWLVASTVIIAALQRAVDNEGAPLFLLKGGTMLQYRLSGMSRTTSDVDGLVRGEMDKFLKKLDKVLQEPWGPLTFERTKAETINVPHKLIKPQRFDIKVLLQGKTWRKIQVEIAADEGEAGDHPELIASPTLAGFGLPTPDNLVSISLRYQIAQKIHAVSDPHDPPRITNDRARDVVDLLLLQELCVATQSPTSSEIRDAVVDVFEAREREANKTGGTPRYWPAKVEPYRHWGPSFGNAADSANFPLTLGEAVQQLNLWLRTIDDSLAPAPQG